MVSLGFRILEFRGSGFFESPKHRQTPGPTPLKGYCSTYSWGPGSFEDLRTSGLIDSQNSSGVALRGGFCLSGSRFRGLGFGLGGFGFRGLRLRECRV